jgi:excisionase family DNA binding protein
MSTEIDLVTLGQLARRLRVASSWLRRETEAGRLPHLRAGRQRLFNLQVVERVLAERAATAGRGAVESER